MKKLLNVALGIVTSIGGYLDVGSIASCAQAAKSKDRWTPKKKRLTSKREP